MKTRIAMTFGLALILVFGVLGAMAALGQVDPKSVLASHGVGTVVSSVQVEAEPNDPGAIAKWTIRFQNNQTLDGGVDSIIIEFEDDVKPFPPVISPADVTITTSRYSNDAAGTGTTGAVVANPLGVNVRFVAQYTAASSGLTGNDQEGSGNKDEPEVTLEIGDMEPSTNEPGFQGIEGTTAGPHPVTTVTVVFRQTAGLLNPTESKSNLVCNVVASCTNTAGVVRATAGEAPGIGALHRLTGYDVRVGTSTALDRILAVTTEGADQTALIPRKIILSDRDGVRDRTITVTGKGFRNGTTATVWLDTTIGGTRDTGEVDLANVVVAGDDTFTASISISAPPFVTAGAGTNRVNAIDGRNNRVIDNLTFVNPITGSTYSDTTPIYILESSFTVTPKTASIGDTVQVTVKDFVDAAALSAANITITIGGVPIDTPTGAITNSEGTFNILIPNGVPVGSQSLLIDAGTTTDLVNGLNPRQTMTITGAVLTLTPTTVVPNQSITVIGRGYSNTATINADNDASSLTISGSILGLKAAGAVRTNKFNDNASVTTDNGGNWSANLIIPINSVTTTPGTHTLKIEDNAGREGVVDLVVNARTITLDPVASRVGSIVTVIGTGFPADNTATGSDAVPSVAINYTVLGVARTVATFTPDAAGNLSGTFKVPLDAGIPSTNSVRAEYTCPTGTGCTTVTTAVTHEIPRAILTLDPIEGPPGTSVSVSGVGFRGFSTVSALNIGSIDVRPAPVPSTGEIGTFTTSFIVPELNTGAQSVVSTVSNTTASSSFIVTAAAVVPTPAPLLGPTAPAAAFAELIANNDNLLRVWHFDPATQDVGPDFGWFLYDPRPVFALANTVTEIAGGKFYWVNVREAQTALVCGATRTLFAGWNPVTC